MGKDLSPLQVIFILWIFLCLLVPIFWFHGNALDVPRLTHMHLSPAGHLHLQLGHELLEFDQEEKFVRAIDLPELGVESEVTDFAFFGNGDLLIRFGRDQRSPWFNIRRFFRLENKTPEVRGSRDGRLVRCDLEARECTDFAMPRFNLDDTFHLEVDWSTDRVFLADSSRHRLLMFSPQGSLLGQVTSGLRFPNQLTYADGLLYVANTNRHEITVFDVSEHDLMISQGHSFRVDPAGSNPGDNRWPQSVSALGDEIWLVSATRNMANGIGLRFSPQGRFLGRLPAPETADLFGILPFGDQVLVADFENSRVYRYSLSGERLNDFTPAELTRRVDMLNERREANFRYMYAVIVLFLLALSGGVGLALRQSHLAYVVPPPASGEELLVGPDTPGILWLEVDARIARQLRMLVWLLPGTAFLLLAMSLFLVKGLSTDLVLVMVAMAGLLVIFLNRLSRQRIGIKGDLMVLDNGRGGYAAGKGRRIRYSKNHIAIDGVWIVLRTSQSLFAEDQLVTHVYPLLKQADYITAGQMQWIQIRQNPLHALAVLALVLALVFFLVSSAGKLW